MIVPYCCLYCEESDHREEDCPSKLVNKLYKKKIIPKYVYLLDALLVDELEPSAKKINFLTLDLQDAQRQISYYQKKSKNLEIELMIKDLQIKNLRSLVNP